MQIKKSRSAIMGFAAALVLIYHMIPTPRGGDAVSRILQYLITVSYVGVDMFFFSSGYMVPYSNMTRPLAYLKKRFIRLVPIFWLSCIAAVFTGVLKLKNLVITMLGIDLFLHGGGSFLWFLPGLILLYLLMPLYMTVRRRFGTYPTYLGTLLLWGILIAVLCQFKGAQPCMIFLMRLPIFFTGIYLSDAEGHWEPVTQGVIGGVFTVGGGILSYFFGFTNRLNKPAEGMFYIVAIPLTLGLIMLLDLLYARWKGTVNRFLGKITLELYCVQMAGGAKLFSVIFKLTKNKNVAGWGSILVIVLIAWVISFLYGTVTDAIEKAKKSKKENDTKGNRTEVSPK